jgi:hypothetical protein
MGQKPNLEAVSDDELRRRLSEFLRQSRCAEAELIAHIAEFDARRLYAREAAPSMFAWCTETLHLSEQEAYLRITVARASREHPMLLSMLRDGRLHLSGIARLVPHLTHENRDTVLKRATGMSHRQVKELVSELEPKPDAPARIRKLPDRSSRATVADSPQLGAPRVELPPTSPGPAVPGGEGGPEGPMAAGAASSLDLRRDEAEPVLGRQASVEPLAPARFKVQFTASVELRDKLERLQALMRSSVPDGDLAKIIDVAVTKELERLEAKRFGKTKKPRKNLAQTDTRAKSRYIPAAVRRFVEKRDQGRCTYTDKHGRRCSKRHDLEFHHIRPFGLGGDHSPEELALMCRTHNGLLAEQDFGKEKMARYGRRGRPDSPAVTRNVEVVATASDGRGLRPEWQPASQEDPST